MGQAVGTCGTFVAGIGAASACKEIQSECQGRNCHVSMGNEVPEACAGAGCIVEHDLTITGVVHRVELPQGVIGVFRDNEPVVGIRAHTLPYVQAIGQRPSSKPSPAYRPALGSTLPFTHCFFNDFPFMLPLVKPSDDIIVAFGTRTVLKLSLWGTAKVESAPLDFNVLGEVKLPIRRLLCMPQPVDVTVPITPSGESLPHVAQVRLSLSVAPTGGASEVPDLITQRSIHDHSQRHPDISGAQLMRRELSERDAAAVDTEILQLEDQLRKLKAVRIGQAPLSTCIAHSGEDMYAEATGR